MKVESCSCVSCSSKRERRVIAGAPASSSARAVPTSSASGEAPGNSGWASFSPRYSTERSMGASLQGCGGGRPDVGDGGALRHHDLRQLLVDAVALGHVLLRPG